LQYTARGFHIEGCDPAGPQSQIGGRQNEAD
jgi:hypothetical protein